MGRENLLLLARDRTGDIPRILSFWSFQVVVFVVKSICCCCESRGRQLLWLRGTALQGRVGKGFANWVSDLTAGYTYLLGFKFNIFYL